MTIFHLTSVVKNMDIVDILHMKDLKIAPFVDINRLTTGEFYESRIPISFMCEKDHMKKFITFWMRKSRKMFIPSLSKFTKLLQL